MKKVYVDQLTSVSGDKYRKYWENKIGIFKENYLEDRGMDTFAIQVKDDDWKKQSNNRKLLIYHVAISSLLSNGNEGIRRIRETFDVLEGSKNERFTVFSVHPTVKELERIDPELWKSFNALIDEYNDRFVKGNNGILDMDYEAEDHVGSIDAYYGDGGYLAHLCRLNKKPVMIRMGS